ncbi:hypothetical protein ACFOUP_11140 [Belliella kenyensis]|uniref:Uncharacterized protein n=1 Tax=Belliella kenyensis TaxID=1472724 RepID=A0ABV8ENX4_9BACT|nr:hypothetical protein [Belliella kenyensis]MCH7403726.1 hypothetical protein [Belliella kenyensis]MDN3602485.1 hypothetical protein [Belliella kenyensis]
MRKFNLIASILIFFGTYSELMSQTGVSTTSPHPSAIMHMNVNSLPVGQKRGFLFPRVSLSSITQGSPIASPVTGLWVYNTQNTTGVNGVTANRLYVWNGSSWEKYVTLQELIAYLSPLDYYLSATSTFLLSSTNLSNFNSMSSVVPIPWATGDVLITNPGYVERLNDTEFEIKTTGYYDFTGFINHNPKISSTSSKTGVRLNLQRSTNSGSTWTNIASTMYTMERRATNTPHSITIPFDLTLLQAGDRIRMSFTKAVSGDTNHGSNAGIEPTTANNTPTRSLRITYLTD